MTSSIAIYLRCRPHSDPSSAIRIDPELSVVQVGMDRTEDEDVKNFVNNANQMYQFQFNTTFGTNATQEDIFNIVMCPIVGDLLSGINGTVFAYGQTV